MPLKTIGQMNPIKNDPLPEKQLFSSTIEHVLPTQIVCSNPTQPKQWKSLDIYKALTTNNEHLYKDYCEKNNDMSKITDWESQWYTFLTSMKGSTWETAEPQIRDFVENLRRIRHNALCASKQNVLDREDRQVWPAETVATLFLEGRIEEYKGITEEYAGDEPTDPKWQKRWEEFVKSLEDVKTENKQLVKLIALFMTAQRTKKYRRSKASKGNTLTE
jgi:hypothetical protein